VISIAFAYKKTVVSTVFMFCMQ